jgi:formate hydrogenlyase subunit 4
LRLVRAGNLFTASSSIDGGTTWNALGVPTSVALPATVNVGLAVGSHVDATVATGTFDGVTITQP